MIRAGIGGFLRERDLNGSEAERCAELFLMRRNLVLLQRNYRCRFGEIDLIMRDGIALVFVEVRMRTSTTFGGAGTSITLSKQKKLIYAARHYLASLKSAPPCRFDAVLLSGWGGESIEWIRNAFDE
ncbi:MAG: YraN family protein [Nitrosospira sp.]|nr:YraN family protein [Nitrosospira sp.]